MLPSWIFGSLLLVFILGVFIFVRETLPRFKHQLLAFICALLAGLFAYFFTGTMQLAGNIGLKGGVGSLGVQASGGIGVFVLVLWWWSSGWAPDKVAKVPKPVWKEKKRTETDR
jgi:hypothetical protein